MKIEVSNVVHFQVVTLLLCFFLGIELPAFPDPRRWIVHVSVEDIKKVGSLVVYYHVFYAIHIAWVRSAAQGLKT